MSFYKVLLTIVTLLKLSFVCTHTAVFPIRRISACQVIANAIRLRAVSARNPTSVSFSCTFFFTFLRVVSVKALSLWDVFAEICD